MENTQICKLFACCQHTGNILIPNWEVKGKWTDFKENLTRAAVSKMELEGMASNIKGTEDAVRRDQLMALMMAGM